jgi:hypothetical protein
MPAEKKLHPGDESETYGDASSDLPFLLWQKEDISILA